MSASAEAFFDEGLQYGRFRGKMDVALFANCMSISTDVWSQEIGNVAGFPLFHFTFYSSSGRSLL